MLCGTNVICSVCIVQCEWMYVPHGHMHTTCIIIQYCVDLYSYCMYMKTCILSNLGYTACMYCVVLFINVCM